MRYGIFAALICAMLLSSACFAERFFYTGTMTHREGLFMDLSFSVGKVTGFYYEGYSCGHSKLVGTYTQRNVRLKFYYPNGRDIGVFNGALSQGRKQISGTWEITSAAAISSRSPNSVIRRHIHPYRFSLQAAAQYHTTKRHVSKVNLQASYPRFLSPSAGWRALNAAIVAEIKDTEADFVKESRQPGAYIRRDWQQILEYDVEYATPALASMRALRFIDTGGAHPNTFITGVNYLVTDKGIRTIKLTDLFKPDAAFLQPLYANLITQINAEKKRRQVENPIDKLTMADVQSFTLCPRGITFIFQPYAVGAYVEGTYDIYVPFTTEGLSDLFTREGVLGEMVKKGSCR